MASKNDNKQLCISSFNSFDEHSSTESSIQAKQTCFFFILEENADPQSVLKEATELLQTKFGFYSTTIQVEPYCEDMIHCAQCQDPMD